MNSIIKCSAIIDGDKPQASYNQCIMIESGRIAQVGGEIISKSHQLIELEGHTILPGLIDAHVHPLVLDSEDYQFTHIKKDSAYKALSALRRVQDHLKAGWTTLRIAGDADVGYGAIALRDSIREGLHQGPRILAAPHYISSTGGGGDINYLSHEQHVVADGKIVDGVEGMRKAVREEIKYGADWIKLIVSGAFMSAVDSPYDCHFARDELEMAVSEASARQRPVMAHAHSAESIVRSVKAGVRSIEHGTFINDEGVELMKKLGVYLIPTIYIGDYFLEEKSESAQQVKQNELTRRLRDRYMENYRKAFIAGVNIGVGTDNVAFPIQYGVRELRCLREIGMTPMQAIQAATKVNAEMLKLDDEIGTLQEGKVADIIAVPGNPLEDFSLMEKVSFVMQSGFKI